eukprot:m.50941 g.50941  ORF g.50941 m.50941 type:complete len:101 (-) comp11198_c0_seq1:311-613(-)
MVCDGNTSSSRLLCVRISGNSTWCQQTTIFRHNLLIGHFRLDVVVVVGFLLPMQRFSFVLDLSSSGSHLFEQNPLHSIYRGDWRDVARHPTCCFATDSRL